MPDFLSVTVSDEIYVLDLIGTFAFATYGAYFAQKKRFDLFGILVAAFITAAGGGTIREVILGHLPFYFFDNNYILAIIMATAFSIGVYKYFDRIHSWMLVIDGVGLVTFAFIGAFKANQLRLGAFAMIFLATVTAVGGGIMRDVVMNDIPEVLHRDFYATVAVLLGAAYALTARHMSNFLWVNLLLMIAFGIRMLAIHFKFGLWKPRE